MKILRLRVAGFGPYKSEQVVDFEAFDDDGIFLITGKTGAGKSSILDAICYALYGSVPRYKDSKAKLRSDHASNDDPSVVELDFRVGTTDYRVRRSPEYERPRLRGGGTTISKSTAELAVLTGPDWRVETDWNVIAARPVDVGADLARLVGLSKDQFLQVILLAQNRFQEFLNASNDDRQSVLRSLFGTDRFLGYETYLVDRRRALELELGGVTVAVAHQAEQFAAMLGRDVNEVPEHPSPSWFEEGLAELHAARDHAVATSSAADEAAMAAESLLRAAEQTLARQVRRDAAAASLERHLAESMEAPRAAVRAAARAATVWSSITARRTADNELLAARALELDARAAYAGFATAQAGTAQTGTAQAGTAQTATAQTATAPTGPVQAGSAQADADPVTVSAIDEVIDSLTRQLGALESVLTEEAELASLTDAVEEARATVLALDESAAEAASQAERLPPQITGAQSTLTDTRVAAAAMPAALDAASRIERAVEAAREVTLLRDQLAAAHLIEAAASRSLTAATAAHQDLMDRRFADHAAELAAALVDGEPCAVCGSTAHPVPASTDAAPVTSADIDAARAKLDRTRTVLDDSSRSSRGLATTLAEAEARSDGQPLEVLEPQRDLALAAVEVARVAGEEVSTLESEITVLQSRLARADARLVELRDLRQAALAQKAERERELDTVTKRVADRREGFDTVASRVAHLHLHLSAAKAVERAIGSVTERQRVLQDATDALVAALAEHGFETESDAEAARLEPGDLHRIEREIRDHEQGVATARATLAEPELADLPGDAVELDGPRAAALVAREQRDAAMSASSVLRERARGAEHLVAEAMRQLAASVDLRSEFDEVRELAAAVQGKEPNTRRMRLETYVLAAQLEQIVAAANVRLRVMTSGRFALEHDDSVQYRNTQSGLGFAILDEHTGRSRSTNSLSGGETFQVSLALALGLAEVVSNQAGGIRLDTLFIDEGFGALDPETLEIAMTTLDGLRAGGRTIGLISHVDSMKEQIPAKLAVTVTPRGDSVITIPGVLAGDSTSQVALV